MRAYLLALLLVCAHVWAQPVETTFEEIEVIPVMIVHTSSNGHGHLIIAMASRAPFPQPRAVSPQRKAVLAMFANCREEAVKLCGVQPEEPVCPMRIAKCLLTATSARAAEMSPSCRTSMAVLDAFMAHEPPPHRAPPAATHSHSHSRLLCLARSFFEFLFGGSVLHIFLVNALIGCLLALLCMVLQESLCANEAHNEVDVVMSEPLPVEVVLTAAVVQVRLHKETSQDQL